MTRFRRDGSTKPPAPRNVIARSYYIGVRSEEHDISKGDTRNGLLTLQNFVAGNIAVGSAVRLPVEDAVQVAFERVTVEGGRKASGVRHQSNRRALWMEFRQRPPFEWALLALLLRTCMVWYGTV